MADPIITKEQLQARLGAVQFGRVFDDNGDGVGNKLPEEQLRRDASGKVRGAIGLVFDSDLLTADLSDELTRITLDVAVAMAAIRRPTILKGIDGPEAMKQCNDDLKLLRTGVSNLGIKTPPERAANQGGVVIQDGQTVAQSRAGRACVRTFSGNWGDF